MRKIFSKQSSVGNNGLMASSFGITTVVAKERFGSSPYVIVNFLLKNQGWNSVLTK